MQLIFSTWMQVKDYLNRSKGCIIPIGSTEQHGPIGPIGTDAICAEVMAKELGSAVDALVAPTINVGMSVHHLAFPGSMTLRPLLLVQLIQEYILSLAGMGLERFFIVNGHGGNEASINAAIWEVYARAPEMRMEHACRIKIMFVSWWNVERASKLKQELFGDKDGSHATPAEISVAMYAHPEYSWQAAELPPAVDPLIPGRRLGSGTADFQRDWPEGHINSDPTLARPEHGKRLVKACVEGMSEMYGSFLSA